MKLLFSCFLIIFVQGNLYCTLFFSHFGPATNVLNFINMGHLCARQFFIIKIEIYRCSIRLLWSCQWVIHCQDI